MRIMFEALATGADEADKSGSGLFDASPEGNVFVNDVDIVPLGERLCACVVEFAVEDSATPVFHCIFECGDGEDDD
jgi:hypothetical protein